MLWFGMLATVASNIRFNTMAMSHAWPSQPIHNGWSQARMTTQCGFFTKKQEGPPAVILFTTPPCDLLRPTHGYHCWLQVGMTTLVCCGTCNLRTRYLSHSIRNWINLYLVRKGALIIVMAPRLPTHPPNQLPRLLMKPREDIWTLTNANSKNQNRSFMKTHFPWLNSAPGLW